MVNVWASWCAPCVEEHPLLLDLQREHGDELAVVGIVYDDASDQATRFLERYGDGGWPDLTDADGRLALDLGVTGPPETFFVDADGIVRYRHVGPADRRRAGGAAAPRSGSHHEAIAVWSWPGRACWRWAWPWP